MKTIALLPVITYPEPNPEMVVPRAVAMAAALGAQLHALAINVEIRNISNALSRRLVDVPKMTREAEALCRDRGEAFLAKAVLEAKRAGVDSTTDAVASNAPLLNDTAAIQARYYDLVLCAWEANNPTSRTTAQAIIFGSGRPTILLPEVEPVTKLHSLAIAWDGSRVAARAVADAHQVLRRASKITVLTVTGEKSLRETDAAQRLAQGLNLRGLSAEAMPFVSEDCPVEVSLQERAIEIGADLMIMGAFGHTRLRDFVLGGATKGILSDVRLPIMLSH
ncbi:universal stress protein [Mesorhizobium sp.]|uniref:universal stress protein n=1 Tax=Mesorhizobium sp. TaxID=1871066 RepID=UPI000FE367C6|nr:universal stress protein [Mesorhizobium sp.]RWN52166.1 MAG: universal stress protein [Mesorhizobium sp.]RWN73239.1 MAG: universal stress protein [Mesorhizobium sp.]RWN75367.1 MAG: universal stress protein [Mesorhizobium sp.]RWN83044.1 MAG: universal stress protein [Mesorhizobium sp.]RWO10890.1 MAG: universal stress protein [Mesorhizobium sp.]